MNGILLSESFFDIGFRSFLIRGNAFLEEINVNLEEYSVMDVSLYKGKTDVVWTDLKRKFMKRITIYPKNNIFYIEGEGGSEDITLKTTKEKVNIDLYWNVKKCKLEIVFDDLNIELIEEDFAGWLENQKIYLTYNYMNYTSSKTINFELGPRDVSEYGVIIGCTVFYENFEKEINKYEYIINEFDAIRVTGWIGSKEKVFLQDNTIKSIIFDVDRERNHLLIYVVKNNSSLEIVELY